MAQSGSSNSMAFIIGGLVVVVAIIAYFVFGDGMAMVGGGDSTSVTVDTGGATDGAATGGETAAPADNN